MRHCKKTFIGILTVLLCLVCSMFAFVACGDNNNSQSEEKTKYTVAYYTNDTTLFYEQQVEEGGTLTVPTENPQGESNETFVGWAIWNGTASETTAYDFTAQGAKTVNADMKFKALFEIDNETGDDNSSENDNSGGNDNSSGGQGNGNDGSGSGAGDNENDGYTPICP